MASGYQKLGSGILQLDNWRKVEDEIQMHDPDPMRREDWARAREEMHQKFIERLLPNEKVETLLQDYHRPWSHARLLDVDFARADAEEWEIVALIQPILTHVDPVGYSTFPGYLLKYHFDAHYWWESGVIALQLEGALTLQTLEYIVIRCLSPRRRAGNGRPVYYKTLC